MTRAASGLSNRARRLRLRRSVIAASGSLVLTAALTAAVQQSAQPSVTTITGSLNGVSAVSASDAWAVGNSSAQPLIVHWNGTSWSRVTSPSAPFGNLYGVSMVSATDGWAVGTCQCGGGGVLILHWNGSSWAMLPNPASPNGSLRGVSMVSASDGWAVGLVGGSHGTAPLVLHWNGTSWTQVPVSVTASIPELNAVSAASASDAWAVGDYAISGGAQNTLTLHWNGTSWTQVPSPNPTRQNILAGVSDASPGNAWAVGFQVAKTLTLHWNGTAWRRVASPSPSHVPCSGCNIPPNELAGVATISASDAWSAGDYTTSTGGQAGLTLHWNGTSWARVPNPLHGSGTSVSFLKGISMVSATDGWAVGGNIILHWNGTSWSRS